MLLYRAMAIFPRWCGNLESFFLFSLSLFDCFFISSYIYWFISSYISSALHKCSAPLFFGVLFIHLTPVCLLHTSFLIASRGRYRESP